MCSRKISGTQIESQALESQGEELELNSGGTGEPLKVLERKRDFYQVFTLEI